MQRFIDEILEQPQALRRAVAQAETQQDMLLELGEDIRRGRYQRIVLTGMGSSIYASYPLYLALVDSVATPVTWLEASELLHSAPALIDSTTLLIAVSQSGESAEVVELLRLPDKPQTLVGVTNLADNTLARAADVQLQTLAGPEATVSSKTYTTTLALLSLIARAADAGDVAVQLTEIESAAAKVEDYLAQWQDQIQKMADFFGHIDALTFVGRGSSLASAWTAGLITAESAKLTCSALSGGLFRHGPLELARSGFNIVIFHGQGKQAALNLALAEELVAYDARVMVIGGQQAPAAPNALHVPLPLLPATIMPILEIVPVQLLTIPLAQARGFTPAEFEHAAKVTATEE